MFWNLDSTTNYFNLLKEVIIKWAITLIKENYNVQKQNKALSNKNKCFFLTK